MDQPIDDAKRAALELQLREGAIELLEYSQASSMLLELETGDANPYYIVVATKEEIDEVLERHLRGATGDAGVGHGMTH